MGLLDIFRRGKDRRAAPSPVKEKIEYRETLYSQDTPPTIVHPTPPRRKWEHISSIEEKIDKLNQTKISESEISDIEKKVDELISKVKE